MIGKGCTLRVPVINVLQEYIPLRLICTGLLVIVLSVLPAMGNEEPASQKEERALNLPYMFYNENFGLAIGYAYGIHGIPQPQSSLVATVMTGSEGAYMAFFMGSDIRLPLSQRLFLDPIVSIGYFTDADAYVDGNPLFRSERSGANDSNEDNYVSGDGWDNYFRLRFKYLLPIGSGRNRIVPQYILENGLLKEGATGAYSLNPLESGRSFAEIRPFYRNQQIEGDTIDGEIKTNGLDFAFFWDNRDFPMNPSAGNGLRFKTARDFGFFDSSGSWTNIEGEFDFYIPLTPSDRFRQVVLAFDAWSSFSPTWDVNEDGTITGRPPAYSGATLGGLLRMKGYPAQRFSDKAAVYYSADARFTPHWNPFNDMPWLQKFVGVQWIQIAPFCEFGRVAPHWNLEELHEDMKWSGGIAIRAMAKGLIVRMDSAFSPEGLSMQMMVNYPFQF